MIVDRDNPVSGPASNVMSLDEAKEFLRVIETQEDTLIESFITSAQKYAEEAIGQQFVTATYNGYLDCFPDSDIIEIGFPPLQSVVSVKYYDTAGNLQTISADDYSVDITRKPGRILLGYCKSWPSTYSIRNAVIIQFTCGYGNASQVPANIKLAVKKLLHDYWFERSTEGKTPDQFYRLLSVSSHGAP